MALGLLLLLLCVITRDQNKILQRLAIFEALAKAEPKGVP